MCLDSKLREQSERSSLEPGQRVSIHVGRPSRFVRSDFRKVIGYCGFQGTPFLARRLGNFNPTQPQFQGCRFSLLLPKSLVSVFANTGPSLPFLAHGPETEIVTPLGMVLWPPCHESKQRLYPTCWRERRFQEMPIPIAQLHRILRVTLLDISIPASSKSGRKIDHHSAQDCHTECQTIKMSRVFNLWRRGGDSNPRYRF